MNRYITKLPALEGELLPPGYVPPEPPRAVQPKGIWEPCKGDKCKRYIQSTEQLTARMPPCKKNCPHCAHNKWAQKYGGSPRKIFKHRWG